MIEGGRKDFINRRVRVVEHENMSDSYREKYLGMVGTIVEIDKAYVNSSYEVKLDDEKEIVCFNRIILDLYLPIDNILDDLELLEKEIESKSD